jgi:hypothetical protein
MMNKETVNNKLLKFTRGRQTLLSLPANVRRNSPCGTLSSWTQST